MPPSQGWGQPAPPSQGYPGAPAYPPNSGAYPPGAYGAPGYGQGFGQVAQPSQNQPPYQPGMPIYQAAPMATMSPASVYLPPVRQRRTGVTIAIVALIVAFMIAGAGAAFLALSQASPSTASSTTPGIPDASVILSDPLTANTNGWTDDGAHCTFKSDGYHIIGGYLCYAPVGDLTNVTAQVHAQLRSGAMTEGFGMALRRVSKGNEYVFLINGDGHWTFIRCVNAKCANIVNWTPANAIHSGQNAANTLKVQMDGSQFHFYVNGTLVGSATDATFPSGQVGVVGAAGTNTDVVFTQMLITKNGNG